MSRSSTHWRARPIGADLVKAGILLVPMAAATVTGVVVARLVAPPAGFWPRIGWSLLVLGSSTGVLLAVERLVRRAAPLALLLRLGLAFPDEAPRRFGVALRAIRPGRRREGGRDEAAASLALLA